MGKAVAFNRIVFMIDLGGLEPLAQMQVSKGTIKCLGCGWDISLNLQADDDHLIAITEILMEGLRHRE